MPSPDQPIDDADFEDELRKHNLRSPEPDEDGSWGWTPGRIASVLLLVAIVGFWMWAFSPLAPRGHPDELDNSAFTVQAEARCTIANDGLAAIPGAREAVDLEDRADQIEASTAVLHELIADLRDSSASLNASDGELVAFWLTDWDTYLADRERHTARLRAGEDPPFEVTAKNNDPVTAPIDLFATINRMPACVSPGDV